MITSELIGKRICKVLGFEPSLVKSIEITVTAGEPVIIRIERYVDETEAEGILESLDGLRITPISTED